MDSHSRSASPREPSRPQHRPPSPPSTPPAFDNQGYQHDESDPNHNDSFTSNGPPQQNGHNKEPNGDTKTLEAVNLELINLTPKNGNAKQKKDVEVDMNSSNPYDEYFVPVNEHRKYMRGEKLYVTADKRGEKGGCKRPLCWTLLGLVVAVIVALIVLAATGVLFTNSPTPVEQYNGSISSARAFGSIGNIQNPRQEHSNDNEGIHDHDHNGHVHDHDHGHEHHEQSQDMDHSQNNVHDSPATTKIPEHEPDTQNDMEQDQSVLGSDEGTDESMYVPRTLEGELKIDNEEFSDALQDPESDEYREFEAGFSNALKRALFDRNTLEKGNDEIIVEVVQLEKGSVIVTYRIHWKPKPNAKVTEDLLTEDKLKTTLDNYLSENNRMISIYHVAEENMKTRRVLDLCLMNKKDCQYGCEFDEITLEFTCTCPQGQILDMRNPKMCISILENTSHTEHNLNEDIKQKELKIAVDLNASTTRPIPEEEKPNTESIHFAEKENTFDWKETQHETAQTTTESDADLNFSHIFGHPSEKHDYHEAQTVKPENNHEQRASRVPEPTLDPEPTAEPKPESEPTSEPEPKSEPEPTSESIAEPKLEPKQTSAPEPAAEPNPEPEPTPEPESVAKPKPEPEPTSQPEPKLQQTTMEPLQTTSESQSAFKNKHEISFEHLHPVEPEISAEESITESQPAHTTELLPTTESRHISESEIVSETASKQEPASEPKVTTETQMTSEFMVTIKPQFSSEPQSTTEPEPITEPQSVLKQSGDVENSHEPKQSIDNKYTSEIKSTVFMNEGKYDINMDDENDELVETTTMKISTLKSSNINESFNSMKPLIISITGENKESNSNFASKDKETTDNEWLEEDSVFQNSKKESNSENKNSTDMNTSTFMDLTNIKKYNDNDHITEQRSFKTLDIDDFITESSTVTANSSNNANDDISFDLITKGNEVPITDTTIKMQKEDTFTTESATFSIIEKRLQENLTPIPISITTIKSSVINEPDHEIPDATNAEDLKSDIKNKTEESQTDKSMITTLLEEARLLNSTETDHKERMETTTIQPEIGTEYSMVNQFRQTDEDKDLIGALNKKSETNNNETSTEKDITDEGSEITFDAINMLYNRSSKSIEDQINTGQAVTTTDSNSLLKETISSTDSDWLSESVTEINYQEAMNKMEKHETTELTINKIDEIMNHGSIKDDFEPDYLNNMGTTSGKMSESEEPLYGMIHDYDNEDFRVKRVNTESKGTTTENMIKEIPTEINAKVTTTSASKFTNVPFETTTVSEYIYKTAGKTMNESISVSRNHNETISIHTTFTNSEPAPVWEESDLDKDLTVKELPHKIEDRNTQVTTSHMIQANEIVMPTLLTSTTNTITSTTMAPTTMLISNESQKISNHSVYSENTTQVNNLNVTIYEISSHNGNQTFVTPKPTSTRSAEYVDHETDMNPFLPEVENNKSLVKKLQEGHDLEPTNLNETQNENVEEHSVTSSEGTDQSSNGTVNIPPKDNESMGTVTTDTEDTLFNDLLMNSHSQEEELKGSKDKSKEIGEVPSVQEKPDEIEIKSIDISKKIEEKEILPISTFLLDTDDLDTSKEHTTEYKTTLAANDLENEAINSPSTVPEKITTNSKIMIDNENLSVVPIAEEIEKKETMKKNYKSENIQELNYISDSPKKSDRRTLDATKLDSVINNEA